MRRQISPTADGMRGDLIGRSIATLGDQALASAFSLQLGFVAAQVLSSSDFGRFAVLFTTFLVARGVARAIALDPLTIRHASYVIAPEASIAASLTVVVAAAAGVVAAGASLVGWIDPLVAVAGTVSLLALMAVDAARMIDVTAGRPAVAIRLGLVLLIVSWIPFAVALRRGGSLSGLLFGVALAAFAALLTRRPLIALSSDPARIMSWMRESWVLARPLLLDFAVIAGAGYAAIYLLAVIDLEEAGALRAAHMVAAPLFMVFTGITQLVMTEASRGRTEPGVSETLTARSLVAGLVIAAAHLVVVILGRDLFAELLGETGPGASDAIVATSLMAALTLPSFVVTGLLRATHAADLVMKARLSAAPVVVVATVVGAMTSGATGVAIWGAGAQLVTLPLWIAAYKLAGRRTQ